MTNTLQTILAVTALSGELSPCALARIVPGRRYRYALMEQLRSDKLIRTYTRDRVKGYRLTLRAKKQLLCSVPERYAGILQGSTHTNHVPSELPRRLRLHRISETLAMMADSGVLLFADQKANLFLDGMSVTGNVPLPAFYLSKEIHALGDLSIKMQNARMTGVLLADTGYFLVYNTAGGVMRWTPASEQKTALLLSEHFCHRLRWDQYSGQGAGAIMLGEDMAVAEQLLTGLGGFLHQYFSLDSAVFDHFHFLPNSSEGSAVLRLLLDSKARTALTGELRGAFLPKTLGINFEYDATADPETPVLFGWDFDMVRLRSFYTGICSRSLKGIIMAFDFQAEVLEHYFGSAASIHTMSLERARRWLLETR